MAGDDLLDGIVLFDQNIRLKGKKYPFELRWICYASEQKRTFAIFTNDFAIKAKDISWLYKHRWQYELLFRWIKQHPRVLSFLGTSENAVKI